MKTNPICLSLLIPLFFEFAHKKCQGTTTITIKAYQLQNLQFQYKMSYPWQLEYFIIKLTLIFSRLISEKNKLL